MPLKASGPATDYREIDRREGGVGWIAHPEEGLERASHAVAVDGDVWVADPLDVPGLDDLLAEYGGVAGVVTLLDRHRRDAAAVATRHDVPVHVPEWMDGVAGDLDAPVERVHRELGDSGIGVHRLVDNRFWQEALLAVEPRNEVLVPEAVGTASHYRTGAERLGVHPFLRLTPPTRLGRFDPDRLLLGHGAGIATDAGDALEEAVSKARTRAPALTVKLLRDALLG
ncbi:MAG: hypothetical protein ABEJ30_01390 [Halorientalis sp.]